MEGLVVDDDGAVPGAYHAGGAGVKGHRLTFWEAKKFPNHLNIVLAVIGIVGSGNEMQARYESVHVEGRCYRPDWMRDFQMEITWTPKE